MIVAKPAFMEEYERLQQELEGLYQVYIEKYRNIDYLENQLEKYNKIENEKQARAQRELELLQKKLQKEGIEKFKGMDELNDDGLLEEERGFTRGNSRRVDREGGFREEGGFKGKMGMDDSEEDDDQGEE